MPRTHLALFQKYNLGTTSRQGPPTKFGSGTLLRVQIPVQEKRPIELVIPTIRRWVGV